MKITRKGTRKGLDIDYQVDVETPEQVDALHKSLLAKGLLFTYARGDVPYQRFESNTVLHYIDPKYRVYDYAILFTPQPPREKKERSLDAEYERSKVDPEYKKYFMQYMKYHKILTAFKKHMKAYGEPLRGEHKDLFDKLIQDIGKSIIPIENHEYTIKYIRSLDNDLKKILVPN